MLNSALAVLTPMRKQTLLCRLSWLVIAAWLVPGGATVVANPMRCRVRRDVLPPHFLSATRMD